MQNKRNSQIYSIKNTRPQTGKTSTNNFSNEVLDVTTNHQRVYSFANSRGINEMNTKYDSLINNQKDSSWLKTPKAEETRVLIAKKPTEFKDYYGEVQNSLETQPKSVNLLQKIANSDIKAWINYNLLQDTRERGRRKIVKMKKEVESNKIVGKMHRKVISWQKKNLDFDNYSGFDTEISNELPRKPVPGVKFFNIYL